MNGGLCGFSGLLLKDKGQAMVFPGLCKVSSWGAVISWALGEQRVPNNVNINPRGSFRGPPSISKEAAGCTANDVGDGQRKTGRWE